MRIDKTLFAIAFASLFAGSAMASSFTGPISPYYLDDNENRTIYVVQGTSVVNSFPWAYDTNNNLSENMMAVSSTVNTRPSTVPLSDYGGQYTLSGTPTGVKETYPLPPGDIEEDSYDGTSDGLHNYYVDYWETKSTGGMMESVYQTSLTWQNPTKLFSFGPDEFGLFAGIAYDPANQSLWLSGSQQDSIADYSLSGTLLSGFSPGFFQPDAIFPALGYDAADNTLWLSYAGNLLMQYSTTGTLLQSGTPTGLPNGQFDAGDFSITSPSVPEPMSLLLTLVGAVALIVGRKRLPVRHRLVHLPPRTR